MGVTAKDIEKLTGSQKVAIVLLSLSDENATRIFSLMSEDEITDISHAMSHLGAVSPEVIDSVMDQLAGGLTGDSMFLGNLHSTERLLEKILDKDRDVLFSSMSQRAAKIIEEDLMALGSVRVKDVDAARGDVVAVAKKLIEAGEIDVALNSNDDEFVT